MSNLIHQNCSNGSSLAGTFPHKTPSHHQFVATHNLQQHTTCNTHSLVLKRQPVATGEDVEVRALHRTTSPPFAFKTQDISTPSPHTSVR